MAVHAESLTAPRPAAAQQTGLWSWITTVDHKRVGIMYLIVSFIFFLVGGLEAALIRAQLAQPNLSIASADLFNALFTMHGTTMVFLAIMPLSAGFINYFLPLVLGARDVAFPRLNAFSFWTFLFGGIFLSTSWVAAFIDAKAGIGAVPSGGWVSYVPLTGLAFSKGMGVDFWLLGVQFLGLGTLISGFNFITTIINMRAKGMSLMHMPLFAWTTLVMSFLVIFSFPSITIAVFMLMIDRFFGANFFTVAAGADPVLWQHLFWVFGHPEVYILILPAMGIVSEVLPTFSRKPLFGYSVMALSTAIIGFLAFAVWGHHMFSVGQGPVVNTVFSLTTMAIAIPTGVKIFNWLSTMWGGHVRLTTAMLYAIGFVALFTIGGLSGVMHASAPSNYQQHDSYFIVAHFHYVLIGGALFGLFAGFYYWMPKMTGRLLDEKLGKLGYWLMFIGFNTVFFPQHFLGLMGMPRRIYTYGEGMGWELWNLVSSIGVIPLTLGILVFMYNWYVSIVKKQGQIAGNDPWDGRTLEWSIPSPPPVYNFRDEPYGYGVDPFWTKKYPEHAPAAAAAAHQTAAAHAGSAPAGPAKIHMPSASIWPFMTGLALLVMSYGGVIHTKASGLSGILSIVGLLMTIVSIFAWAFEDDSGYYLEVEAEQ